MTTSGTTYTNEAILQQRLAEREDLAEKSKWQEAVVVAEQVVSLEEAKHGKQDCETADAMYRLGWLANCACQPDKAEKVWLQTLSVQEKVCGQGSFATGRTLRSLGFLYQVRAGDRRWEDYLNRSLTILQQQAGSNSVEVAKVVCGLGNGYFLWGEFAQAQTAGRRAVQICERSGAESAREYERALDLLGRISAALCQYSEAETWFSRELEICLKRVGPDHVEAALVMDALARAYAFQLRFPEAERLFAKSLSIQEQAWADYEQKNLFGTLEHFGELYLAWGKLAKAEGLLARALGVLDQPQWLDRRNAAASLLALATIHERRGDYDAAFDLVSRATSLREGHPSDLLPCWLRLAEVEYESGNRDEALRHAQAVEQAENQVLAEVFSFTSEPERLAWQHERITSRSLNLWASLGAAEPLARCVLKTKGIVLDSVIEENWLSEASRDPEVQRLAIQLKGARLKLAQAAETEPQGRETAQPSAADSEAALTQLETIEAGLARKVARSGTVKSALSASPEQVEAALPGDTALVELVQYGRLVGRGTSEDCYGALLFTRDSAAQWVELGPAQKLNQNIRLYTHMVRNRQDAGELRKVLVKLSRQIWDPIRIELPPGISRIIFSPDAELNFLSFATLLESEQTFLGEHYCISYVSSGRDILMEELKSVNEHQLTIVANPDFGMPLASELTAPRLRGLDFQPLPGAQKEGLWLQEHAEELGFRKVTLLLGAQARKTELLKIRSPDVLHLATHGFVLPSVTSAATRNSGTTRDDLKQLSPMLHSGLALAGAETTLKALASGKPVSIEDNGIMTAEEICCLDLEGTRLVVLSACDTGLGEAYAGEGVLGLRRAFAQAGAQSLLLTLWPVEDQTTSRLIVDFYKAFSKINDAAEALAQTQAHWLKELRARKGLAEACRTVGPFVINFRGRLSSNEDGPQFSQTNPLK
jgi:CHAT domain-containing protein